MRHGAILARARLGFLLVDDEPSANRVVHAAAKRVAGAIKTNKIKDIRITGQQATVNGDAVRNFGAKIR